MQFPIEGRIIKSGKAKSGKYWANILVEGKNGAADVSMLFTEYELKVGASFKGVVDGQVQFIREVVTEGKKV
jgi:hypothetical protein